MYTTPAKTIYDEMKNKEIGPPKNKLECDAQ